MVTSRPRSVQLLQTMWNINDVQGYNHVRRMQAGRIIRRICKRLGLNPEMHLGG